MKNIDLFRQAAELPDNEDPAMGEPEPEDGLDELAEPSWAESIAIFTGSSIEVQQDYIAWCKAHRYAVIHSRDSHVTMGESGRRVYSLVVFYMEQEQ